MANVFQLKSDYFNELLSKQNNFLEELKKKRTVIGVSTVEIWIKEMVNCVKEGINFNNAIDSTPTTSHVITDVNKGNKNVVNIIDSQDIQESEIDVEIDVENNTIENRLRNLEKIVEKLVLPQNHKKPLNHKHMNQMNPKFKNYSNVQRFGKNCFICGRSGHLSYNCYHNQNSNQIQRQHNRQNNFHKQNQFIPRYQYLSQSLPSNATTFLVDPIQEYSGHRIQQYSRPPIQQYSGNPLQIIPGQLYQQNSHHM